MCLRSRVQVGPAMMMTIGQNKSCEFRVRSTYRSSAQSAAYSSSVVGSWQWGTLMKITRSWRCCCCCRRWWLVVPRANSPLRLFINARNVFWPLWPAALHRNNYRDSCLLRPRRGLSTFFAIRVQLYTMHCEQKSV